MMLGRSLMPSTVYEQREQQEITPRNSSTPDDEWPALEIESPELLSDLARAVFIELQHEERPLVLQAKRERPEPPASPFRPGRGQSWATDATTQG